MQLVHPSSWETVDTPIQTAVHMLQAIKSKEYRRRTNKAARRKAAKDGDGTSEALKEAAEQAEFERAKVTAREKNFCPSCLALSAASTLYPMCLTALWWNTVTYQMDVE